MLLRRSGICRPRTSIVTGSQLQLDLLTAKLKKLEEEQAESEARLSTDSGPGDGSAASTASAVTGSVSRSPFEPESRRKVGFEDEAGQESRVNPLSRQQSSNPYSEQRHGEESILRAEATPAGVASSWNQNGNHSKDKGPSLQSIHVEPERLPQATAEQDGTFVLKGVNRVKSAGGQSRVQKLESFDRRIGRQPNAIKEVSLMTYSLYV